MHRPGQLEHVVEAHAGEVWKPHQEFLCTGLMQKSFLFASQWRLDTKVKETIFPLLDISHLTRVSHIMLEIFGFNAFSMSRKIHV